jgi:hypothetical protein
MRTTIEPVESFATRVRALCGLALADIPDMSWDAWPGGAVIMARRDTTVFIYHTPTYTVGGPSDPAWRAAPSCRVRKTCPTPCARCPFTRRLK